jgi:hypothetical protein
MSATCNRSRTFVFLLVILTAKVEGQVHRDHAEDLLERVSCGGTATDCSAAQLPLIWVNNLEYLESGGNTIYFPASGTDGAWTCLGVNYGPYSARSMTSLNQAVQDAEFCRTAGGGGTNIIVPHGSLFSATTGIKLPQTAGDNSTDFIVINSDTPLQMGTTVCSHGVQDNVPSSEQPGIRNVGCNAINLSYQVGSTVTALFGNFSLANGTTTSSSAYNDVASMYTIECSAPNCDAISASTWDFNNIGPHHFAVLNGEFRPQAGSSGGAAPVAIGTGNVTLPSQLPNHIHFAYDYAHGDWLDAVCTADCSTSNPIYAAPTGHTSLPNDYVLSCIYCSLTYSYADQSLRPGAEGHGIYCLYCSQLKLVHNWIEGNSTHGLFVGGQASDLAITSMIGGTDVEDRGSRYTYPWTWMWAEQSGNKPLGGSYVNKNGEELKNGLRVLRDGNIYEHVDLSGGQGGGVTAKVAQCSAGKLCSNYFLITSDITMTNNIIRMTCYGTGFGDGGNSIDGGGVSLGVHNVNFSNNLLYGNGQFPVTPGCLASHLTPTNGYVIRPGTGFMSWTGCTARSDDSGNETATCAPVPGGTQLDFVPGDHIAISLCSDSTFDAGFGGGIGPLAPSSTEPTALSITFQNPGVTPSSSTAGCTIWKGQGKPEHIRIVHNTAVAIDQESGSPVLAGSVEPGGVPMNFQWNATLQNNIFLSNWTNLAQAGGINGYPEEGTRTEANLFDITTLTLNHNVIQGRGLYGVVNCNGANPDVCTYVSGDTFYSSPYYSRLPTGSIILASSRYPVKSVNAAAETFTLASTGPAGTSLSYFWADYTEYGGPNSGAQPPVTIYFPVEPCAVGNDPTVESTVGFIGTMSLGGGCVLRSGANGTWTGYPTLLTDWHGYGLCHAGDEACDSKASPFASGQPNQATDGTDQGSAISALDPAETRILYPCPSCADGNGPYPDSPPQTSTDNDFSFTVDPPVILIGASGSATAKVSSISNGWTGVLTLGCNGLPAGAWCSPDNIALTAGGSAVLDISDKQLAPRDYSFSIIGATDEAARTVNAVLRVESFGAFLNKTTATLYPGQSVTFFVTLTSLNHYSGSVTTLCKAPVGTLICAVVPSSTMLTDGSTASTQLTLTAPMLVSAVRPTLSFSRQNRFFLLWLLPLSIVVVHKAKRSYLKFMLVASLAASISCGGRGYTRGTSENATTDPGSAQKIIIPVTAQASTSEYTLGPIVITLD